MKKSRQIHVMSFLQSSIGLNALFVLEGVTNFALHIAVVTSLGLGERSDVLYAAWMLPQTIGRGMFQSLTNSFMGLFTGQEDSETAYNQAITVVAALSIPLSTSLAVTGVWWLPFTIPGAAQETRLGAIPLVKVLAWLVSFLALTETARAIYYRRGHRSWPSLARLLGSALAVILVIFAARDQDLLTVAWGVTLGAAFEALLSLAGLWWLLGLKYRPIWPERRRLREIGTVVGAPLGGQGIQVLAGVIERALASLLIPGSVTAVTYASRIVSSLERFVFRGFVIMTIHTQPGMGETDLRARFRLVTLIAIPMSIVFVVLPHPLVAVIFGYGRLSSLDVNTLALTLQAYAPALLGIALTRIPFGLAYAQKKGAIVLVYFGLVSSTLVLAETLLIHLGVGLRSFGLSYSLAMGVALIWLYWALLRPQHRQIFSLADSVRLLVVSISAWIGAAVLVLLANGWTATPRWGNWVSLAAGSIGCLGGLVATAYGFQLEEIQYLRSFLRVLQERRST